MISEKKGGNKKSVNEKRRKEQTRWCEPMGLWSAIGQGKTKKGARGKDTTGMACLNCEGQADWLTRCSIGTVPTKKAVTCCFFDVFVISFFLLCHGMGLGLSLPHTPLLLACLLQLSFWFSVLLLLSAE